jgi:hypothetical protein
VKLGISGFNPEAGYWKEKHMSKPTHIAYVVTEPREGSDKKAVWHEVGGVWPHEKGKGFDVVIHKQVSVSGRIVCTERKEKTADDKAAAATAEDNAAAE